MLPASQSSTSYTEEPLAPRSPFHHKEGEDKSNKKCQESNYILLGRPFKIHIESPPAVLVDFRSRKHLVTEAEVSLDYLTCPSLFHSPKGASVASALKEHWRQPTQLVFLVYILSYFLQEAAANCNMLEQQPSFHSPFSWYIIVAGAV